MKTLLNIADDVRALATLIDDLEGGEIDAELGHVLDGWFAQIGEERDRKLSAYHGLCRYYTLLVSGAKEERERLDMLVHSREAKLKGLKDRLALFFGMTGIKKFEGMSGNLTLCNNGGLQPLEVKPIPEELDRRFQRIRVEAHTDAIREALKAGEDIPGCRLLPRGQHIRIS